MKDAERKERITAEIINAGGERAISEISEEDRPVWEQQALVLSFVRESGNVEAAAFLAGLTPGQVTLWYDNDTLGFVKRRASALEQVGWQRYGTIWDKIVAGEITNPTLVRMCIEPLLPGVFDSKSQGAKGKGDGLAEQLRKLNMDHKEAMAQIAEINEARQASQAAGEDSDGQPPVIDLAARRAQ